MIKYLIAFILIASPCIAGVGIGGFPYPGPGMINRTYTLTIDGTGWNGTDLISVGGSTYTADGTKTGLSGITSITVTPDTGRTATCSGTGVTGSSSPYSADMSADRIIACTFSAVGGVTYYKGFPSDVETTSSPSGDPSGGYSYVNDGLDKTYLRKVIIPAGSTVHSVWIWSGGEYSAATKSAVVYAYVDDATAGAKLASGTLSQSAYAWSESAVSGTTYFATETTVFVGIQTTNTSGYEFARIDSLSTGGWYITSSAADPLGAVSTIADRSAIIVLEYER